MQAQGRTEEHRGAKRVVRGAKRVVRGERRKGAKENKLD